MAVIVRIWRTYTCNDLSMSTFDSLLCCWSTVFACPCCPCLHLLHWPLNVVLALCVMMLYGMFCADHTQQGAVCSACSSRQPTVNCHSSMFCQWTQRDASHGFGCNDEQATVAQAHCMIMHTIMHMLPHLHPCQQRQSAFVADAVLASPLALSLAPYVLKHAPSRASAVISLLLCYHRAADWVLHVCYMCDVSSWHRTPMLHFTITLIPQRECFDVCCKAHSYTVPTAGTLRQLGKLGASMLGNSPLCQSVYHGMRRPWLHIHQLPR